MRLSEGKEPILIAELHGKTKIYIPHMRKDKILVTDGYFFKFIFLSWVIGFVIIAKVTTRFPL